ncbi:membrane bound O-acyl transferase family-domain-containing protein [Mucidula mucida]|nr:membrane bound O-acyl transferase family-domain-containing protein [Mucidula mucida]
MANSKPVSIEALVFAVLCLTSSLVVVKSSIPPWLFFVAALVSSVYLSTTTTGSMAADYPMAFGIAWFVLIASDYIMLSDPRREFQWARQKGKDIENAPLLARVEWTVRLLSSPRGIGWSQEPVGLFREKPAPGTSRISFIIGRAVSVLRCMLTIDVASLYLRHYSALVEGGVPLEERPWYWAMVDQFIWALLIVSNAEFCHTIISLVSVALHLSRPEDWTHLFGYWSDAYTIRRFWGRAWHQCLRRVFSVHGKFIARRLLHAEPGTKTSSYTQLYVAFLSSGLMHLVGERKVGVGWTESNCLVFFLLHAVAITAEDAVIAVGRRAGIRGGRVVHILGYIWTLMWFYKTLPIWWDPEQRAQNMFNKTFLPIGLYKLFLY